MNIAGFDIEAQRRDLREMPNYGRVVSYSRKRANGSIRITWRLDFSPDLKGRDRFLNGIKGQGFKDSDEAEQCRAMICAQSKAIGLKTAVDQFRRDESRDDLVAQVIENYFGDAPTLPSPKTGRLLAKSTLTTYRRIAERDALPFFRYFGHSMEDLARNQKIVMRFKAWIGNRSLYPDIATHGGDQKDDGQCNGVTFLKTIGAYYALDHPTYSPRWPAVESKATIRQNKPPKPPMRFEHVLDAYDAIPDAKRGPFITAYFTQRRWGEIRGIRGADYDPARRLLTICRAKDGPEPDAPVRDRPKGKVGLYPMPHQFHDWVMKHCKERLGSDELPLFVNPAPEARPYGGEWSHGAIRATWRAACLKAKVPYTGPYEAFKHAIVTALLESGADEADVRANTALTTSAVMRIFYDRDDQNRRSRAMAQVINLKEATRKKKRIDGAE